MNKIKIINKLYNYLSSFYVYILGRKKLQFLNNIIFSLSLDAKGFKSYGTFKKTGEENLIKLIKDEIKYSLDIGANTGRYSKLLLEKTNTKLYSFEPLPKAYKELSKLKEIYSNRFECFNFAIGQNCSSKYIYHSNKISEKASLIKNLEKLSFIGNANKNKTLIKVKSLDSI